MFANTANGPDCWKCSLHVEWHDCSWCPSIALRQGIASRQGTPARPLPDPSVFPHPVRRKNLAKPMNLIGNRKPKIGNSPAFTLVELLTVIAIIGILAAMLLTALPAAITAAKKARAKTEISQIVNAIEAYDSAYSRFPVSSGNILPNAQAAASTLNGDFTYGGTFQTPSGTTSIGTTGYMVTNAEVMAILMDLTSYPNGVNTINLNHQKNPKQTKFLNAKQVSDNTLPGVGTDGVYRDPWGNPYVISMDLNFDELCKDTFYCLNNVSGYNQTASNPGLNGLTTDGTANNFQFHGKVMVWSAGPDKKVDPTVPANQGANKDNILSWQ